MRSLCLFLALFIFTGSRAQSDSTQLAGDSLDQARVQKKMIYSGPRKASIMSAVLPGLGQGYNRKYWKIPIIYAAIGGFGYVFKTNNDQYNSYRAALRQSVSDNSGFAEIDGFNYSTRELQLQKNAFKRLRDIGIIGMGIVYILNIVDANVDAHLRTFDVSDDLSLRVLPDLQVTVAQGRTQYVPGCFLRLNFR